MSTTGAAPDTVATPPAPAAAPAPGVVPERRLRRRTPWFGVTGLVLLAALMAAFFVQVRQHALLGASVQDQDDYTALSLYQLEVEYLRLREAMRPAGGADTEPNGSLQLRYDIFISRVGLLDTVRSRRLLAGIGAGPETVRAIESFVTRADVYLGADARAPLSPAAADALRTELDRLGEPIHQLMLDVSHVVAGQITTRRDQVRQHNQAGLALTAFLSAMVLAFAGIALHQMRKLELRRRRLEVLADELRDARAIAEAASAAKSAFLADMSHELRTPLHGLLGMLSLTAEAPRDARAPQWLATAGESGSHLQRLLDDMLDLSKLESGTLALAPQPVRLEALVREVCALMRPAAEAKQLTFDIAVQPTLPVHVLLDPTRTKQVLFNLLHNAIKYSDVGTVTMRCRRVGDDDPQPQIEFEVGDNGIGMSAVSLTQLFQRFSRGDIPQVRRQGGTGLGLAISRNLAQLMGGELVVRSTPGSGSVFTFRCPLAEASEPSADLAMPARLDRCLEVLIAEDHPINRMYLGALLERMGHRPRQAVNGLEAVQAARAQHFDLVLMDVHMPVMDGVAAAEAIRALPTAQATPRIVALTADVFADTRQRCLRVGIDEVVTKPVSAASLGELLRRHFGVAAEPPAGLAPPPPQAGQPVLIDRTAQADVRQAMGAQHSRSVYAALFEQASSAGVAMREAMRAADVEGLRREAHAVEGASLNLGLPALAEVAAVLSSEAHAMAAPQLALAVQRFDEMVQATRALCAAEGLLDG
ncbi:ATP-binding protein [Ideonella sp. A 288]|uniref:hybrid sensor histidine kinase/response regulator n=1 Tax=Ideonella sp. A 288 TaxID=1962181 RepID=UPI000B4BC350|nr:ATP-binding protein [Ideonella sp. A 288]